MATTMKLIGRTVLGADTNDVTFSDIPGTGYTDLLVYHSTRSNRSGFVNDAVYMKLNTSTANFTVRFLEGDGGSATSGSASVGFAGQATANNATASTFSNSLIYIPNYAGSTNKSYSVDSVQETNATGAVMSLIAGLWSNTAAITSLTLYPSLGTQFRSGSSFFLFGISKA